MYFVVRLLLVIVFIFSMGGAASSADAVEKAYEWLKSQQVPNSVVTYPVMKRRHLVLSFELNRDNPLNENDKSFQYVFSRSSLYDNALAIIAFVMMGDFKRASQIIESLYRNIDEKGFLWFTYNTHNNWPDETDTSWAISRNGASAWAGYAILFYIQAKLQSENLKIDRNNVLNDPELKDYLELCSLIADHILTWQIQDKKDNRYGLIIGGLNRLELVYDEDKNSVYEKFLEGPTPWVSVEHNIDAYFFLRDLAKIAQNKKYEDAATTLKEALLKKAWNHELSQFARGVREKEQDTALALDCASWGSLFALAVGDRDKAVKAYGASEKYKIVQDKEKNIYGYKPYLSGLVYEEQSDVNTYYFPRNPHVSWKDFDMIWPEGSLGVAFSALKLGDSKKVENILEAMKNFQAPSGGILYASRDVPYQFSTSPSVAGTAWFIMVAQSLKNENMRNLFWGED